MSILQIQFLSTHVHAVGFVAEGVPVAATAKLNANYYLVTPDYFRAMGIRVLRGRSFSNTDDAATAPGALISETTARRLFGDGDSLDRHLTARADPQRTAAIIGIVADVKHGALDRPAPLQVYEPYVQRPFRSLTLVVRGDLSPGLVPAVRQILTRIDPTIALGKVQTLEAALGQSIAQRAFTLQLLFGFGFGIVARPPVAGCARRAALRSLSL